MQKNQKILKQQYHKHERLCFRCRNILNGFSFHCIVFVLSICGIFCTMSRLYNESYPIHVGYLHYSDYVYKTADLSDDYQVRYGLHDQYVDHQELSLFDGAFGLFANGHQDSFFVEPHNNIILISTHTNRTGKVLHNPHRQQELLCYGSSLLSSCKQLNKDMKSLSRRKS